MKKIVRSIVLGMCVAAPMITEAATYTVTPNPIVTSASFNSQGPVNGAFSDTWKFTVGSNSGGNSSVTNASFSSNGAISNFAAVIDNAINFTLSTQSLGGGNVLTLLSGSFGSLSVGAHTLVVSGNASNASYGGNIVIDSAPSGVPVPAAIWLFGSALVGLMGVSGRKKTLS